MPLSSDTSAALSLLERIQRAMKENDDAKLSDQCNNDLNTLISVLESPVFRGIVNIQESLKELKKQVSQHPSIVPADFDITREGKLVLHVSPEFAVACEAATLPLNSSIMVQREEELRDAEPSICSEKIELQEMGQGKEVSDGSHDGDEMPPSITNATLDEELQRAIQAAAQGRDIHHIQLYKPDGSSLGFSVVGLRSEKRGELGIYVQGIQATGIAAQDGRLEEGDQILAIDGQVLDSYISHQQAIGILQKATRLVDLVVARAPPLEKQHQSLASLEQDQPLQKHEKQPSSASVTAQPQEPNATDMLNTEWAQVEVIDLINDGSGLGFGIIGGRSTGVVVKTILPGGVADRDSRLRSGDHILQIGDVNLRGMGSDQVAAVLRQSGSHVRLIVARPVEPTSPDFQVGRSAPIVETRVLNDPEELERHLSLLHNGYPPTTTADPVVAASGSPATNGHIAPYTNGDTDALTRESLVGGGVGEVSTVTTEAHLHYPEVQVEGEGGSSASSLSPPGPVAEAQLQQQPAQAGALEGESAIHTYTEDDLALVEGALPEMETIDVEVTKDHQGLGITIAGYVCEREELSGIFVKSINMGSAADRNGQIQVNDQIVQVDGRSLAGLSNHAAVDVLRATGQVVRLRLARYLRGPKYEQLQQAIANSELKTTPTTPNPPRAQMGELPSSEAIRTALGDLEMNVEDPVMVEAINPALSAPTSSSTIIADVPTFSTISNQPPQPPVLSSGMNSSYATTTNVPQLSSTIPQLSSGVPPLSSGTSTDIRLEDIELMIDSNYSGELRPSVENAIKRKWSRIVGPEFEIVVAQLSKFEEGGGLGISLEGTVDVEGGREVRPHHYIRSILPDGPVGKNGRLCSGDELLEVNGQKLLGLNHVEVVGILKELPGSVRLVCGRRAPGAPPPLHPIDAPTADRDTFAARNILGGSLQNLIPGSERLVKAKSDGSLASSATAATNDTSFNRMKSRSLEPLTGLAMWSSEAQIIELMKGDRGLGFSILDYQDPLNPQETVIVIRSLVPGGVAEKDGRLIPGDRLIAVNGTNLENATLDQAVAALKGAPKGPVSIAVAKPISVLESTGQAQTPDSDDPTASHPRRNLLDAILGEFGASGDGDLHDNQLLDKTDGGDEEDDEERGEEEDRDDEEDLDDHMYRGHRASVLMVPVATERLIGSGPTNMAAAPSTTSLPAAQPPSQTHAAYAHGTGGGAGSGDEDQTTPHSSPQLSRWAAQVPPLPKEMERTIKIKKGADQLGVNIEVVDQGVNGVVVSSLVRNGAVHKDGRLHAGDFILSVNNESMRNITNSQARAILRRTQLVSTDVSICYIRGQDAAAFREASLLQYRSGQQEQHQQSQQSQQQTSPRIFPKYYRSPYVPRGDSSEDETAGGINSDLTRSITAPSFITRDLRSRDPSHEDLLGSISSLPQQPETEVGGLTVINIKHALSETLAETRAEESNISSVHIGGEENKNIEEDSEEGPFTITFKNVSEAHPEYNPKVGLEPEAEDHEVLGVLQGDGGLTAAPSEGRSSTASPMLDGKHWGPERTVEVRRDDKNSLGISIVGGKVDLSWSGSSVTGIFIKNVLPDSPAGKGGHLKTGDRILEVEGVDLRGATHEKAVEVIKKTGNPVTFVVQSLVQWTPANSAPPSRDVSRLGTRMPNSISPARTPTPELIQPGLPDHKKQEIQANLHHPLNRRQTTEDSEDEVDDERYEQGRIETKKGVEIDRASAGAIRRSKAEKSADQEEEDEFGYTKKKIAKKYGDLKGEVILVDLQKGANGLGISLAGNKDRTLMSAFICGLNPNGNAFKDGRLRVGDEILEVNGNVIYGRCHLNASSIFKGIPGPTVKVIVLRKKTGLQEMAIKPITQFPVTLEDETPEEKYARFKGLTNIVMKKGSTGLGIMIIEGKHAEYGQGIFISDLQEGSVAAEAGLLVGDIILCVNKEEMVGVDYDQATNILKKTEGVINMWVANPARAGGGDPKKPAAGKKPDVPPKPALGPKPALPAKPPSISSLPPPAATPVTSSTEIQMAPSSPPIPPGRAAPVERLSSHGLASITSTTSSISTASSPSSLVATDEPKQKGAAAAEGPKEKATAPEAPKEDPATAEIRPGRETTIEIVKEKMGLGLSIVGGSDTLLGAIIIHEVYPDGAAAKDGRLKPGDQILNVNNENFRDITHQKALSVLRQTPSKDKEKVKMVVYREEGSQKEEDLYDIITVQLTKKSGKGLGLSIVGRKNGPGVFISDVVPGGVAESDGRLMQGDQILEVNDKDLRQATQEQAAAILKCAPGSVSMKLGRLKAGKKANSNNNANNTWPVTISDSSPEGSTKVPPEPPVPIPRTHLPPLIQPHHLPPQTPPLQQQQQQIQPKEPQETSGIRTILLERRDDGLGFSIVGGFGSNLGDLPIYVKSVFERGAAAREGSLRRGDQILEVNGESLAGLTHAEAVYILKEARGTVALTILPSK
ncbi:multiple PDZ domain protein isoform X16 [Penaeus vannamei]|uniref:multiple PDZ domain protein isoform X16 n=1 Tax=Penaeus vannamei TaxID=6689 RepID=UPI00387F743A